MKTVPLLAAIFVLSSFGTVQAQSGSEIDNLKMEVAQLKKQVEAIKKELAILKPLGLPPKKINLPIRFEAASNLNNFGDQQAAFENLAVEAARQGDAKYTKESLDKISTYGHRQAAIYKASLLLAAAGLEKEGLELAKSLGEFGTRNKALLKIAKGEIEE